MVLSKRSKSYISRLLGGVYKTYSGGAHRRNTSKQCYQVCYQIFLSTCRFLISAVSYSAVMTHVTQVERHDMISAYYRRLTGDDESVRLECARRWSSWEMATSRLRFDPSMLKRAESDIWALQFARIERYMYDARA